VPPWLRNAGLTYHGKPFRWANDGELHVVARGQEFVTDIGEQIEPRNWLRSIQDAIRTANANTDL
jgi:hypothetical protein